MLVNVAYFIKYNPELTKDEKQRLIRKSVINMYFIIHKIDELNFKELRNTPME